MAGPSTLRTNGVADDVYTRSEVDNLIATVGFGTVPIGSIIFFGGINSPVQNYVPCDGSAYSRVQFSVAFGRVGTTYGPGDGLTTFNVPDVRGRSPVGFGLSDAQGATNWGMGTRRGVESVTLTADQMPSHTHTITVIKTSMDDDNTGGLTFGSSNRSVRDNPGTAQSIVNEPVGGGQSVTVQSPGIGLLALFRLY
jgi:microcystin-dependent protein